MHGLNIKKMNKKDANTISLEITAVLAVITLTNIVMRICNSKPTVYYKIIKGILIECNRRYTEGMSKEDILKPLETCKRLEGKPMYKTNKKFTNTIINQNN